MRYAILIIIGLILAGGVVLMMKPSSEKVETPANDGEKVLVAKTDLLPGSFIVISNHVDFVDMDEKDIKPNYTQKKNFIPADMEGAVVRNLIKAGEPIQKEKIVTPKEGGFLSAVLYPGKRAISVGVDVVSANAGFIFPGDKVDLLLTHKVAMQDGSRSFATETFVEDVRVLAIDQQVNNPDHKALVPKTVTLEVTPKQAEEVLVAQELGKISLILRSSGTSANGQEIKVKTSTYTKDSEVSKVLDQTRPADDRSVGITITRGKSTVDTRVSPSPAPNVPVDVVITPPANQNSNQEKPQ